MMEASQSLVISITSQAFRSKKDFMRKKNRGEQYLNLP